MMSFCMLLTFLDIVISSLQKYAMQQAFNTMMGQMSTQSNQFGNAAFSPNSPFPYAPPPASSTSTSPPPVAPQPVTVDVSATKVEETPATDIKDGSEPKKETKKYGILHFLKFSLANNTCLVSIAGTREKVS